jgi:integrase
LPRQPFRPKRVPGKTDLQSFYEAFDSSIGRALFLAYASTGLRKSELLSLKFENVDFKSRMVVPNCHDGETKQSLVNFFGEEAEKALNEYLATRKDREGRVFCIDTHGFLGL